MTKAEATTIDRDVTLVVDMLPEKAHGRRQATAGRIWHCRMKIEDRFFEVRLESEAARFVPGERTAASAKFLSWPAAAPLVRPEVPIEIWELTLVARGRIRSARA